MRDGSAFSPTLPDDEDGYVPAPGAPSQERPEYDGSPSWSKPDPEPGMSRRPVEDGVLGDIEDLNQGQVTAELDKPAGNASRDEWVAYALSLGHTEEQLEGLKRDDLATMFADR